MNYNSVLWWTIVYFDELQQCTSVDYSVLQWTTTVYFGGL